MEVLIIGTGPIGVEYTILLRAMGHTPRTVGRSQAGCDAYAKTTGLLARPGGIDSISPDEPLPAAAIVATTEPQLGKVTAALVRRGVRKILVEKPGGTDFNEVVDLDKLAKAHGASVYIAYNRRFYASVLRTKQLINDDGGVLSCLFEFTEWAHQIEPLVKEPGTKENLFFNNSTHVIDLAFHLAGWPDALSAYSQGQLSWHERARYSGAGQTKNGATFAYFADWQAPGRWSVEVLTRKRRLILKPLEKLQEQLVGSIDINFVKIDDSLDQQYKPGFYRQLHAFLTEPSSLLTLSEQALHVETYRQMHFGIHS